MTNRQKACEMEANSSSVAVIEGMEVQQDKNWVTAVSEADEEMKNVIKLMSGLNIKSDKTLDICFGDYFVHNLFKFQRIQKEVGELVRSFIANASDCSEVEQAATVYKLHEEAVFPVVQYMKCIAVEGFGIALDDHDFRVKANIAFNMRTSAQSETIASRRSGDNFCDFIVASENEKICDNGTKWIGYGVASTRDSLKEIAQPTKINSSKATKSPTIENSSLVMKPQNVDDASLKVKSPKKSSPMTKSPNLNDDNTLTVKYPKTVGNLMNEKPNANDTSRKALSSKIDKSSSPANSLKQTLLTAQSPIIGETSRALESTSKTLFVANSPVIGGISMDSNSTNAYGALRVAQSSKLDETLVTNSPNVASPLVQSTKKTSMTQSSPKKNLRTVNSPKKRSLVNDGDTPRKAKSSKLDEKIRRVESPKRTLLATNTHNIADILRESPKKTPLATLARAAETLRVVKSPNGISITAKSPKFSLDPPKMDENSSSPNKRLQASKISTVDYNSQETLSPKMYDNCREVACPKRILFSPKSPNEADTLRDVKSPKPLTLVGNSSSIGENLCGLNSQKNRLLEVESVNVGDTSRAAKSPKIGTTSRVPRSPEIDDSEVKPIGIDEVEKLQYKILTCYQNMNVPPRLRFKRHLSLMTKLDTSRADNNTTIDATELEVKLKRKR